MGCSDAGSAGEAVSCDRGTWLKLTSDWECCQIFGYSGC